MAGEFKEWWQSRPPVFMGDDRYIPYKENWNRQPDEIEQWLMNQRNRLQEGMRQLPGAVGRGVMGGVDLARGAGEAVHGVGRDIVGSFPNYPANYPGAEIANRPVMDMLRQYGPQAIGMLKEVFGPGEVIQGWPPQRAEFDTEFETKIEPVKVTKVKKQKKKYKRKGSPHAGGY